MISGFEVENRAWGTHGISAYIQSPLDGLRNMLVLPAGDAALLALERRVL